MDISVFLNKYSASFYILYLDQIMAERDIVTIEHPGKHPRWPEVVAKLQSVRNSDHWIAALQRIQAILDDAPELFSAGARVEFFLPICLLTNDKYLNLYSCRLRYLILIVWNSFSCFVSIRHFLFSLPPVRLLPSTYLPNIRSFPSLVPPHSFCYLGLMVMLPFALTHAVPGA